MFFFIRLIFLDVFRPTHGEVLAALLAKRGPKKSLARPLQSEVGKKAAERQALHEKIA
jgi:hypothetical protein